MDFHSGGNADPARRTEAARAGQVSHDMEGIFRAAKPLPKEDVAPHSHGAVILVPGGRNKRSGMGRKLALPGVVMAGALTAGIVLAQLGHSNLSSRQVAKPLPSLAVHVAQGYRLPALVQARPVAAGSTSRTSEVAAKTSATVEPRPRRLASYHPQHKKTERLVMRPRARMALSPSGLSCERLRGAALARCMRPQILDVDRLLRDAYQDAIRAGVDRRVLIAYRRQWSRLRGRANSDPRSVAIGYRRMAQQLAAERTGRRAVAFAWR